MNALVIIFYLVIPWLVGALIGFAMLDLLVDLIRYGLTRLQKTMVSSPAGHSGAGHHS